MATAKTAEPRRRPFGLVVLVVIIGFKAALLLLVLVGAYLPDTGPLHRMLAMPFALALSALDQPVVTAVGVALVSLLSIAALGLVAGDRRGWLLAMVLTGIFLLGEIWDFSQGDANQLWMVLDVITVFYLNQTDVQEVVRGVRVDRDDEGAPA